MALTATHHHAASRCPPLAAHRRLDGGISDAWLAQVRPCRHCRHCPPPACDACRSHPHCRPRTAWRSSRPWMLGTAGPPPQRVRDGPPAAAPIRPTPLCARPSRPRPCGSRGCAMAEPSPCSSRCSLTSGRSRPADGAAGAGVEQQPLRPSTAPETAPSGRCRVHSASGGRGGSSRPASARPLASVRRAASSRRSSVSSRRSSVSGEERKEKGTQILIQYPPRLPKQLPLTVDVDGDVEDTASKWKAATTRLLRAEVVPEAVEPPPPPQPPAASPAADLKPEVASGRPDARSAAEVARRRGERSGGLAPRLRFSVPGADDTFSELDRMRTVVPAASRTHQKSPAAAPLALAGVTPPDPLHWYRKFVRPPRCSGPPCACCAFDAARYACAREESPVELRGKAPQGRRRSPRITTLNEDMAKLAELRERAVQCAARLANLGGGSSELVALANESSEPSLCC